MKQGDLEALTMPSISRPCYAPGRASVALHTEMYFANNPTEEDAFVLSVQKSKLTVIVPRFGIEGTVSTAVVTATLCCSLHSSFSRWGLRATIQRSDGITMIRPTIYAD